MARIIDITDKLNFNENPVLKIGSVEAEVNADAETVLRLMGVFSGETNLCTVKQALNLIFKPEDVEAICAMKENGKKLSARSLMTIVQEAVELVMGEDNPGEDQTRTMT